MDHEWSKMIATMTKEERMSYLDPIDQKGVVATFTQLHRNVFQLTLAVFSPG